MEPQIDSKLTRQLIKQLKILNFWITLFGSLMLAALIIIGILIYQVIAFTEKTANDVRDFKQSAQEKVDVKGQACGSDGTVGDFLRNHSDLCKTEQQ